VPVSRDDEPVPMSACRTVQRSPILLPVIGSLLVLTIVLVAVADEVWALVGGLTMLFLAVVVVALSTLTVDVGPDAVTATFRYGWPRRRVSYADVVAMRAVRNAWWVGLGIRKVSRGWMYNVWGLDAVQLDLADGRVFRIGTAEPDGLLAALETARTS
jgi:hypothetical protein